MAEILPINFAVPGEASIISYDYADIAERTGIINFYCFGYEDTSGEHFALSTNAVNSSVLYKQSSIISSETYGIRIDLDFDLSQFNMPANLEGNAIAEFTAASAKPTAIDNSVVDWYAVVNIIHYDGSTETNIGTITGKVYTTGGGDTLTPKKHCLIIPITYRHFKNTEILRANIQIWAKKQAGVGNNGSVILYFDPLNRTNAALAAVDAALSTTAKTKIPFQLDI